MRYLNETFHVVKWIEESLIYISMRNANISESPYYYLHSGEHTETKLSTVLI